MSKFRLRGRRRKNHESREGSVPLRAIVPNLITSMAACGGITAIALSATNYAKTLSNPSPRATGSSASSPSSSRASATRWTGASRAS